MRILAVLVVLRPGVISLFGLEGLLNLVQNAIRSLLSFFNLIINLVQGIFSLVSYAPNLLTYLNVFLNYAPAFMSVFLVAGLSVLVVRFVIDR